MIAVVPSRWFRPMYLVAFLFPCLAVSPTAAGQQVSGPDASDHEAFIRLMREAARSYGTHLEDFICTEIVTRTADKSGSGKHWKWLETQELELRYVDHWENYVLLKVNGESKDMDKRIKAGYFQGRSEFGTALWWIFDPKANAQFTWDRDEINLGQRICIFQYQVERATSTRLVQVDSDRLTLEHHGLVYADCQNGSVMKNSHRKRPHYSKQNLQVAIVPASGWQPTGCALWVRGDWHETIPASAVGGRGQPFRANSHESRDPVSELPQVPGRL